MIKKLYEHQVNGILIQEGTVRIRRGYSNGKEFLFIEKYDELKWITEVGFLYEEINIIYSEDDMWDEYIELKDEMLA